MMMIIWLNVEEEQNNSVKIAVVFFLLYVWEFYFNLSDLAKLRSWIISVNRNIFLNQVKSFSQALLLFISKYATEIKNYNFKPSRVLCKHQRFHSMSLQLHLEI
jgi:hypothetical protein